jgi:hypothetical protein
MWIHSGFSDFIRESIVEDTGRVASKKRNYFQFKGRSPVPGQAPADHEKIISSTATFLLVENEKQNSLCITTIASIRNTFLHPEQSAKRNYFCVSKIIADIILKRFQINLTFHHEVGNQR